MNSNAPLCQHDDNAKCAWCIGRETQNNGITVPLSLLKLANLTAQKNVGVFFAAQQGLASQRQVSEIMDANVTLIKLLSKAIEGEDAA